MKIELTQDDIKFILEMINVLNFPGKEVEKIVAIKEKFKKAQIVEEPKVEDKKIT